MVPHFGTPELLIVFGLVLLLFGAKKVPEIARGIGQGLRELKSAMHEVTSEEDPGTSRRDA